MRGSVGGRLCRHVDAFAAGAGVADVAVAVVVVGVVVVVVVLVGVGVVVVVVVLVGVVVGAVVGFSLSVSWIASSSILFTSFVRLGTFPAFVLGKEPRTAAERLRSCQQSQARVTVAKAFSLQSLEAVVASVPGRRNTSERHPVSLAGPFFFLEGSWKPPRTGSESTVVLVHCTEKGELGAQTRFTRAPEAGEMLRKRNGGAEKWRCRAAKKKLLREERKGGERRRRKKEEGERGRREEKKKKRRREEEEKKK